jgi:hypothetical protein
MYTSSDKEIGEKHQVGEKDEGETKKSKQKSRKEQQEQEKQNNYAEGFPENLVIYISLHGSIVIKDERNLEPIEIPDSIEYISKFNIAPPGDEAVLSVRDVIDLSTKSTCIHDEKDIQIYDKIIHKHIEDSDLDTTHDLPTLNRFMCQLQDELKTNYIGNFSKAEIHKPYKYNLEKGRGCKLHTFEKKSSSSSVASAASLDSSPDPPDIFHHLTPPHGKKTMLNKELSTELMISDEPLIGIIVANHRIRNYDILPDILRSLGLPTRSSIRLSPTPLRVTTKQILDFIANIRIDGVPVVKRLFIIDLSCQKFQRPYHELSGLSEQDRQILEAYVNERGYGGGKYKQLKKSRRNKKRKTRKTRKNK